MSFFAKSSQVRIHDSIQRSSSTFLKMSSVPLSIDVGEYTRATDQLLVQHGSSTATFITIVEVEGTTISLMSGYKRNYIEYKLFKEVEMDFLFGVSTM